MLVLYTRYSYCYDVHYIDMEPRITVIASPLMKDLQMIAFCRVMWKLMKKFYRFVC